MASNRVIDNSNITINNNTNNSDQSIIITTSNSITINTKTNKNNDMTPTPINISKDHNSYDADTIYDDIKHLLSDRKTILSNIDSSPTLVAMIALQTKIPHELLPFDSLSIPLLADRPDVIIKSVSNVLTIIHYYLYDVVDDDDDHHHHHHREYFGY